VHDGIEMEKLGIPTASIVTHVFVNTANAMTRMMGVPDFQYVVAPHPLSSLTAQEVKERAARIAPEIERILLGNGAQ
jgi:TctA family transporter